MQRYVTSFLTVPSQTEFWSTILEITLSWWPLYWTGLGQSLKKKTVGIQISHHKNWEYKQTMKVIRLFGWFFTSLYLIYLWPGRRLNFRPTERHLLAVIGYRDCHPQFRVKKSWFWWKADKTVLDMWYTDKHWFIFEQCLVRKKTSTWWTSLIYVFSLKFYFFLYEIC